MVPGELLRGYQSRADARDAVAAPAGCGEGSGVRQPAYTGGRLDVRGNAATGTRVAP
jgi:hypothetical protein